MRVLVLGAGLIGTATAWFAAADGHEVTVIDRQPGPALETSFANGGQISVSHAEPWANPHAPAQILRWLGREDAPLLFRLRADPALWAWGLRFLVECLPGRTLDNIRQLVHLGVYSRATLQQLRRDTGIAYDHLERGILHFFTTPASLEAGLAAARAMAEHGCDSRPLDGAGCVTVEPALAGSTVPILGGTFTPADESGDAHRFTTELALRAQRRGVRFRFLTRVERLRVEAGRFSAADLVGPEGRPERVQAEACVVACGSYSPQLLRPLGIAAPVYPAKGYSITLPLEAGAVAPVTSLTDDEHKLVFSRLGQRLRVAGTAEFAGHDTRVNQVRCQAIARRVAALFPRVGDLDRAEPWAGLRPATPGNVPLIGPSRVPGLYLNTGHGTLGWTHACGSGRALADLLAGRRPEVDFRFLGAAGVRPRVPATSATASSSPP